MLFFLDDRLLNGDYEWYLPNLDGEIGYIYDNADLCLKIFNFFTYAFF